MISLKGMTWDHPRGVDPLVATSSLFGRRFPQVTIEWEARSLQAFGDASIGELARTFDLLIMDHPHVGEVADSGAIVPFEHESREAELDMLRKQSMGRSYESYTWHGRQWALPIDAAVHVAAYRPDQMPTPPATWDAVMELAQEGHVLWAGKPVDAAMTFFSMAASQGTPYPTRPDTAFPSEQAEAVLLRMKQLRENTPEISLKHSPVDVLETMSSSDRFIYCPYLFGYIHYGHASEQSGCVAYADVPSLDGHPATGILGGAGIAISSRCRHRELAEEYAFWIAGMICQREEYLAYHGQPANREVWNDVTLQEYAQGFFPNVSPAMRRAYVRPRYAGYVSFQVALGHIIHDYLKGQTSLADTLRDLSAAQSTNHAAGVSAACLT